MIATLDELSKHYKLDKNAASGCHNYIPGYTALFEDVRFKVKRVLEIGIGSIENGQMGGVIKDGYRTGNSLKCWRDYFPNATIYGIDIFPHPELNEDRICTFVADQSNTAQLERVMGLVGGELDIIIDDGSHEGRHQAISFVFLQKYLTQDGIYVIEDVQPPNIEPFKDLSIFVDSDKSYIADNFTRRWFDTRNTIGRADDFLMCFSRSYARTGIRITHDSGFFSCCSLRLDRIVRYVNMFGLAPESVDSSRQFSWYKNSPDTDITHDYFDTKDTPLLTAPVIFNQTDQFTDYEKLDFQRLVPVVARYFAPSADIIQRIASMEQRYVIDYANTCALFYRGNNKSIETLLSGYDEYIVYAKQIAKQHAGVRFLIQSDETEFIQTMLAAVPNSFYLKDDVRHMPKCNTSVDLAMRSGNHVYSKNYLAATYVMSKCKYVVCGSGNCSIWIVLFRGNANNVYQNLNGKWLSHV